jgi:ankyrin repeat protein
MEIVIENEDPEVITLLIDSVADFDAQDSSGMTALHHASHLCNPAEVELLLNREANLEVQDEFGFTPLARTFFFPKRTDENNYKVVKLLLDAGANVNAWDKKGDSLLMNAVFKYDNPDAVKALIEHGAEIDATNSNGMTPLMLAARNNQNPEIVQTLLDAGAVIKMKDNNGMTAWDHIQENLSLRETKPYRDLKSYFT